MVGRLLFKYKFLWLLVSLLAFFIVIPFIANTKQEMYVFGTLFTIIIAISIYVIKHEKKVVFAAVLLALISILGIWTSILVEASPVLVIIESSLVILFFLLMTITVLFYVAQDRAVSLNTLCGAICGYLLIALTWALAYVLIYYNNPHAFNLPTTPNANFDLVTQLFIYYSFVTQSTLGFGDITPVTRVAETFSWLQAVTGQIYLTVWIAQLVGLHIANKQWHKENKVCDES